MVSTKPIQDRIYRSRLTITYRTNIDGVPVPQQLPFRLLVLGDLTGRKIDDGYARQDDRFEDREVVSVRRGVKVDHVMREMGITLPIPKDTTGPHAGLDRGSTLPGTFDCTGGAGLSANLDVADDDGSCVIRGQVAFRAHLHDNRDITVSGLLPANGKLKVAASVSSKDVALAGNCQLPVKGLASGSPPIAVEVLPSNGGLKLTAKHVVIESVQSQKWTGDVEATLAGAVTPAADNATATCSLEGVISLVVDAQAGKTIEFGVKADDVKLTNTAAAGAPPAWQLDPAAIPSVFAAGVSVKVNATVAATGLLKGPLRVGRRGDFVGELNDATPVKLESEDKTISLTGALKGQLKGNVKGTTDKTPATVPVEVAFSEPAGAGCALDGKLQIQIAAQDVSLDVFGHLRSETSSNGSVVVGPEEDPITVDVDVSNLTKVTEPTAAGLTTTGLTISDDGIVALDVAGNASATRTIPITGLASFSPDAVAQSIPEIRRLGIISVLLWYLRSAINYSTDVRKAMAGWLQEVTSEHWPILRARLEDQYPALVLPEGIRAPMTGSAPPLGRPETRVRQDQDKWFDQQFPRLVEKIFINTGLGPSPRKGSAEADKPEPALVRTETGALVFCDHEKDAVNDHARLLNALAVLILNGKELNLVTAGTLADEIRRIEESINKVVRQHVGFVLRHDTFRSIERNWRGIAELCDEVEDDNVIIDLLDVSPGELQTELLDHKNDIFTSALFKKVYVDEYDRFGGKPFGAMIGLYHFDNSDTDIECLQVMSSIASAAHCPFISSVGPRFFDVASWDQLAFIGDIEGHLQLPKFGKWNELRDSLEAPYVGLTLPGYLLRKPWAAQDNQIGNRLLQLDEVDASAAGEHDQYVWGNSAILFARNMLRSFEQSGWCQYIRGPRGGGLVRGMTVNTIVRHGREEAQSPVEFEIADYRELQFAKAGLIPLVHCKGTSDAVFFSAQSIKKPHDFVSELDTQNSYLMTNIAYTLSITRIAHYVKRMMRDFIGSSLDAAYIQSTLQLWLDDYVTTTVNPDDLTLRFFPFKAVTVSVVPKPGPLGWFKSVISILPHVQFEGMDVELRLEAALGGAK